MDTAVSTRSSEEARADTALALLLLWLVATLGLWFFAFYSLPAETPGWIRRAQAACFGSDESGLPGAAGWMLLVLSPLMLLGALMVALGQEFQHALLRIRRNETFRFLAWLVAGLVIIEVSWIGRNIYSRIGSRFDDATNISATRLPDGYPRGNTIAPDFSLVNQFGERQSISHFHGKPVMLSFIFAHCQTVCPTLVKTVSAAAAEFPPDKVSALFITLDPWRDTPASLPTLARQWELGEGAFLLSGQPAEVNAVLDAYGVPRERDGQSGDVVHPALVHVIAPSGALAYSFNAPSVAWLRDGILRTLQ